MKEGLLSTAELTDAHVNLQRLQQHAQGCTGLGQMGP